MRLRYTEQAELDIQLAFEWYEKQRRGLGFEFLDCLEAGITNIIRWPDTYAICHRSFRRALIRRFPFSIYYTIEEKELVVLA